MLVSPPLPGWAVFIAAFLGWQCRGGGGEAVGWDAAVVPQLKGWIRGGGLRLFTHMGPPLGFPLSQGAACQAGGATSCPPVC